jgi:hypothetical protein
MIPFALPMVLAPRETRRLATRYSGRTLLAAGLAITVAGNAAFWLVAGSHLPYSLFLVAMLVAGCGAGLLNGQTVKVLQGVVAEDRAGMASGIASTTRFIGILVSVAALGAVLADVARDRFVVGATKTDCRPTLRARPLLVRHRAIYPDCWRPHRPACASRCAPSRWRPTGPASRRRPSWQPAWRSRLACSPSG